MPDAAARATKKSATEDRIRTVADLWVKRLGMDWVDVYSTFTLTDDDDDQARVACQTFPEWQYRRANLRWNPNHVALAEDDELTVLIVHELVHVLVAPVWEELKERDQERLGHNNEFVTECVARAIIAAYKADRPQTTGA